MKKLKEDNEKQTKNKKKDVKKHMKINAIN